MILLTVKLRIIPPKLTVLKSSF